MIGKDLVSELTALGTARAPWEKYWRAIASYVLPATPGLSFVSSPLTSVMSGINANAPEAAPRSKKTYDMTSLWGIERLAAGLISLKTPEAEKWHNLGVDELEGEATHEEHVSLERTRDYLFDTRSNPKSGFWAAHRSAMKSMCGFGDGWYYIGDNIEGGRRTPCRYEYAGLPELYPAVDSAGMPDTMFRVYNRTALQLATRYKEGLPDKVVQAANDPTQRHNTYRVLHAIRPRTGSVARRFGIRGSAFETWHMLLDDETVIGQSGYFEFPWVRYAWANTGTCAFSEGPIAYTLAEIASLNELSRNELIAVQAMVRPAFGVASKNLTRIKMNPGDVNPGLVNMDGRPLFSPITNGARLDFAQLVGQQRREAVREMLYLNLWQIILNDVDKTATESLLRAQEKGEMLGPVGISLNSGLSACVDREIGILGRRGAFDRGSPLAVPRSLVGRETNAQFTSPLDRLRRMGELVGINRLLELVFMIAPYKQDILTRIDFDEIIETAQEILGAPARTLRDREQAQNDNQQAAQLQNLITSIEAMRAGGDAAQSVGAGAQAMAAGVDAAATNPRLQRMFTQSAARGLAA